MVLQPTLCKCFKATELGIVFQILKWNTSNTGTDEIQQREEQVGYIDNSDPNREHDYIWFLYGYQHGINKLTK